MMSFTAARWIHAASVLALLGFGLHHAEAQIVPAYPPVLPPDASFSQNASRPSDTSLTLTPSPFSPQPVEGIQPSVGDLLQRLEVTESRLAALQAERTAMLDTTTQPLRSYWEQVRDPSIITVQQQTRSSEDQQAKKKWYERLSLRGYAQFRINDVTEEDPLGAPAQYVGDRSVGDNQSFIIRRARVILSGDVSDYLYVYLQPDFASSTPGSPDAIQFCQIRDWYGDVYFDDH